MELVKAIILKTSQYTDTQKIIHVYSLEKGALSFISPSFVFKRKNQPIQLMQLVEIEYFVNEKGGLHKLRTISPLINLPALYSDIFRMNILLLWSEILHLILRQEGKNEVLFHYISRSAEYLNTTQRDIANFNLLFLYRLAGPLGFHINTSTWQEGYVFDIQEGHFCPPDIVRPYLTGPHTAKVIYQLCTCETGKLKDIPLNREARNILLDVVLLFYSIHLNLNFNIRSIQIIREVFK